MLQERLRRVIGRCLLLSLLIGTSVAYAEENSGTDEIYSYISYSYGGYGVTKLVLDNLNKTVVYPHTIYDMEKCEEGKTYICFRSLPLTFCIPRSNTPTAWWCEGKMFRVVVKSNVTLLGNVIPVIGINSDKEYYYFNTEKGLVGIKFTSDDPLSEFYMLASSLGFGHE